MVERIPAITLTDPQNRDAAPSPAQSPVKHNVTPSIVAGARADGSSRPESSSTSNSNVWQSPAKLIRTLSNTNDRSSREEARGNGSNGYDAHAAMDPLSKHIMNRTNAPFGPSATSRGRPTTADGGGPRRDERRASEQSPAPAVQDPSMPPPPPRTDTSDSAHVNLKKGVKAVSFLTRLMGGGGKKKDVGEDEVRDDMSTSNEERPEGNDAEVFAQSVDNMEFNPRHPRPPAYIKVRSKNKRERDFDRLFLAQELQCRSRSGRLSRQNSGNKLLRKSSMLPDVEMVCAMEFSKDGKYLAAAGADTIVRVWAVLSSPEDRARHQKQESSEGETREGGAQPQHLSAPVFQTQPVRQYEGHNATVLDLSWSKNNFLLSSSMDKTVRLWHVSRPGCLCTFKHNDFVPSITFHPKDDRFFLAGSLDSKLRLWSIPDKSVAYSAQLPDMITAVAFTPDGKYAMAGCLSGLCMFFETEGLRYQTQIHVRSTRGQNAKGSKITGIQAHHSPSGDIKFLVTSNDSRVRLYHFRDKSLELKFKGNENNCSQIRAAFSDDGRYVVCGSEDRKAYIWSLNLTEGETGEKRPVEMFEAHDTITTCVCFAPTKTRLLLGKSEDPVYDLCNPPPVTLVSRAEGVDSQSSSKAPTENGSPVATSPMDTDARYNDKATMRRESPASLVRAGHRGGNIIVTADYTGRIKVFRQDCAWAKRLKQEEWDRSSLFGKRNAGARMSLNGSIVTRGSQRSLVEPRTSTSTARSEQIISWRQGITRTSSTTDATSQRSSSKRASRSNSPPKSIDPRTKPVPPAKEKEPASPKALPDVAAALALDRVPQPRDGPEEPAPARPPDDAGLGPASTDLPARRYDPAHDSNPLHVHGTQSYLFWDKARWKATSERNQRLRAEHARERSHSPSSAPSVDAAEGSPHRAPQDASGHLAVRPRLPPSGPSYVSELSDERSSGETDEEEDDFDDARERLADEEMKCRGCGGASFSARAPAAVGSEASTLACTDCGLAA